MKISRNWFAALLILGIIIFCFARTLNSYFLEDDFGEISYCYKIAEGNWQLLVSNFTGNYMQIQSMQVYRPWLLMSLLFDFLVWRTHAFGYYLTNILFMFGCGLMLYVVMRQLTRTWGEVRSFCASLLTAALFVANPLHSEAVSIVVGRVDIITCFYYLVSLWCFLKRGIRRGRTFLIIGTAAFWLAILTKEMAICLPLLLAGMAFIMPEVVRTTAHEDLSDDSRHYSLAERIALAFRVSLPLWLSTVVYFVIRYLALGTFGGGYAGSIGAGQNSRLLERWSDLDTLHRIVYPFNIQVFGAASIYHVLLSILYFLIGALVLSRWVSKGLPWRWIALISFWSVTTVLPIYQLWGLSENLDGSRFLFFLTMPLSAILPICLLAPATTETFSSGNYKLELASLFCLVSLVLTNSKIACRNNIPWIHAGRQTQACLKQAQILANQIGKNKRAIILGLPAEREGARMILNGVTFNMMISPPFTKRSCAEKFVIFAPIIYGNDELINMQRYKDCIGDPNIVGTYVWNYDALKFERLPLPDLVSMSPAAPALAIQPAVSSIEVYPYAAGQGDWNVEPDGTISIATSTNTSSIALAPLNVNPLEYDFLEFDLAREPGRNKTVSSVFWQGERNSNWQDSYRPLTGLLPTQSGKDFQTIRMPLSRHWRWLNTGNIVKLRLDLPAAKSLKVKNLRIVSAGNLVPDLAIDKLQADNTGVYTTGKEPLNFLIDGASVPGCESVKIELSKPNFFFENLPEPMVGVSGKSASANNNAAVLKSFVCQGALTHLSILPTTFPAAGYYQVRATCLNKDGMAIGERSDPLTLFKTGP
jgi:hypothetical protein